MAHSPRPIFSLRDVMVFLLPVLGVATASGKTSRSPAGKATRPWITGEPGSRFRIETAGNSGKPPTNNPIPVHSNKKKWSIPTNLSFTREYESDRARFLGRGQTPRSPMVFKGNGQELSRTIGATLDPIMSLAQKIDLEPREKAQVTYVTLVGPSRREALVLLNRYQSRLMITRA